MMAGERILIIDDEPEVLDLCRRVLELEGYQVHGVLSGQEARPGRPGDRRSYQTHRPRDCRSNHDRVWHDGDCHQGATPGHG
jgi:hypothetical protein